MMFNKKVNHTKSPPENSFSGGFLNSVTFVFFSSSIVFNVIVEITIKITNIIKINRCFEQNFKKRWLLSLVMINNTLSFGGR